jgi:transmembrane 9 superfamily protein 2/4
MALSEAGVNSVSFTYSVSWIDDPIPWGTRWDHYLHVYDPQIHWISIVNSIAIVVLLSSVLFAILVRALHKDIARYSAPEVSEESGIDEFGWKLVHADVFRPPSHRQIVNRINL